RAAACAGRRNERLPAAAERATGPTPANPGALELSGGAALGGCVGAGELRLWRRRICVAGSSSSGAERPVAPAPRRRGGGASRRDAPRGPAPRLGRRARGAPARADLRRG